MHHSVQRLLAWINGITATGDPRGDIAARIALVIVGNQPFYPLYLHAIVGASAWPAWLTLVTTPFFAAVPHVARRHPRAGRALLVVAGTANTVFCAKLFGLRSGVELFLLPCALLSALLFRAAERILGWSLLALPFLVYLVVDPRLGAAVMRVDDAAVPSLITVNATSVGALISLIGLLASGRMAEKDVGD